MAVTFQSKYHSPRTVLFGDGNSYTIKTAKQYTYQKAGHYEVKLIAECDPDFACIQSDIDTLSICVGQSDCTEQIESKEITENADTTDYQTVSLAKKHASV